MSGFDCVADALLGSELREGAFEERGDKRLSGEWRLEAPEPPSPSLDSSERLRDAG